MKKRVLRLVWWEFKVEFGEPPATLLGRNLANQKIFMRYLYRMHKMSDVKKAFYY